MKVVVVESPAKAKTINKYLGPDYEVIASFGHIRDLPAKDGSVDPEQDFHMVWELADRGASRVSEIAKACKGADKLILATDPDREGEAISWHVLEALNARKALKGIPVERVTFNAITKASVEAAMRKPREIDQALVDAYLARRALDYLVGFNLSPVLWRKLPGARSAGRVQSVALRLVVEREMEIESFKPREYWSIVATLTTKDGATFEARLVGADGKRIQRLDVGTGADAAAFKRDLELASFQVASVEAKPAKRHPQPPFTTSTLQQEASRKLGMAPAQTMRVAQRLYEGVDVGGETVGIITYMRTDGVDMAPEAIQDTRKVIGTEFGDRYVPDVPRKYSVKAKNAQEAHEAVRPTDMSRLPKMVARHLEPEQAKLYDLIWTRTMASQMESAELERTTVEVAASVGPRRIDLRATGQVVKFDGFLALYQEGKDDEEDEESKRLPPMKAGEPLTRERITSTQHFTEPPPRYSEASLVKRMEELGIGRPSTYAATLQVLKDRAYVRTEKNRFFAEESGRLLTAFLERFFPRYVAYDFTAGMEEELDDVSGGRAEWKGVLEAFWKDFKPKSDEVMERKPSEVTEALDAFLSDYLFPPREDGGDPRQCPQCIAEGRPNGRLALRGGRYGAFVACANYPECKYTRKFAQPGGNSEGAAEDGELGKHPETGEPITRKAGRFGPYIQLGEGKEAKRSSIPKDIGELDLDWAVKLLDLPRTIGAHPESGNPITASIGRYGPYLAHAGKYAKLRSTAEVFDTGMNMAVAKLAEAASGAGRGGRTAAEPLKVFAAHPSSGGEMKLMAGRYGPYVTDGTTNATLPRDMKPEDLTEAQAITLIDERAAKGPAKGKGKRKPAAKKTAAKKAPATKAAAKKSVTKKAAAKPSAPMDDVSEDEVPF